MILDKWKFSWNSNMEIFKDEIIVIYCTKFGKQNLGGPGKIFNLKIHILTLKIHFEKFSHGLEKQFIKKDKINDIQMPWPWIFLSSIFKAWIRKCKCKQGNPTTISEITFSIFSRLYQFYSYFTQKYSCYAQWKCRFIKNYDKGHFTNADF